MQPVRVYSSVPVSKKNGLETEGSFLELTSTLVEINKGVSMKLPLKRLPDAGLTVMQVLCGRVSAIWSVRCWNNTG